MDATQLISRRLAIFVTFALLVVAAPWQAQAQPSLVVPSSVVVPSIGSSTSVTVSASDGSAINFTATVTYPGGTSPWLSLNNTCSGTFTGKTPASITLAEGCQSNHLNYQPATITYTATGVSNSGATTTATLGQAGGTVTATTSSGGNNQLTLSAAPGGSTSGTITLSTTSPSPVGFTYNLLNPGSWMTVQQTGGVTGQVSAGTSAVLTVAANAGGLSSSPPQGTVQIAYNGTTLPILVNFNVGTSGNGSLTVSQSSISWSYSSSQNSTGPNYVTVTSPNSAPSYYATITNITGNNWLTLTLNAVTVSTPNISTGFQPIGSILQLMANGNQASLPTGSYSATVQVVDSNNNSNTILVSLSVNGAASGITLSPNPLALSSPFGSTNLVSAVGTLTSNVAGTVSAYTSGNNGIQSGVTLTSTQITAGGSTQVTVYGYANGQASGTYNGTLYVTIGSTQAQFPITFTVGTGTGGGVGDSLAPGTMQFNFETSGNSSQPSQSFMIGGTQGFNIQVTQNGGSGTWLSASPLTGTAPTQGNVTVNPTGLPAGSYSGTVKVNFNDGTSLSMTVNLTVTSNTPLVYSNPGVVVFNQVSGTATYPVYLYTTDSSTLPVTVSTSTSWLTLLSPPTTTQSAFTVQANTSNLPNGMNQGAISVTSGATTLTIPVIAYVTNGTGTGSVLTFSPTTIGLNAGVGSITTQSTTLNVSSTSGTTTFVTAAAVQSNCTQTTWLSVNPSQTNVGGTSYPFTVSANPSGLPAGVCSGQIQFSAGGTTQSVAVTFTIGGGITLSTSSVPFSYTTGGSVPGAQNVTVNTSSTTAISYTATATSTGNWLSVSPTSGSTSSSSPGTLAISVNPASLSAGSYTGTVAVTPTGGTASNITVNLTVTTPNVTVSPTSLAFTYQAGGNTPAAQNVTVSGGGFSATTSSTGNWLSVSPATSANAGNISVSVNPSGLTAGTYNGTITVSPATGLTGGGTVNVTLTVTAPLPTITAVVNAASFLTGAVSPGEVISIGGTGIGPSTPASLTLDSSGKVATTIGGVTVTIGGYPAPLVYVSSGQINAIVPYEVAGQIAPSVVVKYLGQTSNGFTLSAATAVPGIFTQASSGSGPGAILNQDYTVNGPGHPAAKGSVVQVFMTGEGKTTPTAITGGVNNVSNASQLPVPLLPVSASIAGQPAQVLFAAEAPGMVSGIMQVNILVPANAPSGAQSIVVNVGTASSQTGVTVSIQ
jgi:uncharacterized protein (TIGR03437 family)